MLLDLGDWENLPRIGYILNNSCAYRQFISTHTHNKKVCWKYVGFPDGLKSDSNPFV